jgi:hypothetical protein
LVIFSANFCFADLNDGLVAYYPLDGNANDESENGNDGTSYGGLKYVDGVIGKAASLDGINDFIAISSHVIRSLRVFTVSALAKVESFPNSDSIILIHDRQNGDQIPNKHFEFRIRRNVFYSGWESSTGADRYIAYNTFGDDYGMQWVHLALTRDSNGNGKLYINSTLRGTTSGSIEANNTDDFMIGAIRTTGSLGSETLFFNGLVDEVKIWNRSLTQNEIKDLYKVPVASAGPDKIICNEICDSVVLDGRKSFDLNGEIETYDWELDHSEISCSQSADGETPTVTDLCPGVYDVMLTVTDNDGFSSTDEMILRVLNRCDPCAIMQGDFDSDGDVDGDDLRIFSGHFGQAELLLP